MLSNAFLHWNPLKETSEFLKYFQRTGKTDKTNYVNNENCSKISKNNRETTEKWQISLFKRLFLEITQTVSVKKKTQTKKTQNNIKKQILIKDEGKWVKNNYSN